MKKNIAWLGVIFTTIISAGDVHGPVVPKTKLTRELFLQKIQQMSDEIFGQIVTDSHCGTECPYFIKSIVYKADSLMKARELAASRVAVEMAETLVTYFFDTVRGKEARDLAQELQNLSADSAQLFQEFNQSLAERDQRHKAVLVEQAKQDVEKQHAQELAELEALSDEFQRRLALSQQAMDRWIERYDQVVSELKSLKVNQSAPQSLVAPAQIQITADKTAFGLQKEFEHMPMNSSSLYGKIGLTFAAGCTVTAGVSAAIYYVVKMLRRVQLAQVVAGVRNKDRVADVQNEPIALKSAVSECDSQQSKTGDEPF